MTEADAEDQPLFVDDGVDDGPEETATPEARKRAAGADRRRPAPRRAEPGERRGPTTVLVAVTAGFALLAVVLAFLVVGFKSDRDDLASSRDSGDDIARIAGDVASAMLQFDYRNPEAGLPTIEREGATQFVSQYKESLPVLSEPFKQVQGTQAATIKQIYLEHGSNDGEASALVIADLLLAAQGAQSTLPNVRLEMTFAKIDGQWKVTNVTNLNELLAGRGPTTSTSTTTTTAPPAG